MRNALACAALGALAALAPGSAQGADYHNSRLGGFATWLPEHVQGEVSLVTLTGGRENGLLKGSKKVRQDVEVQLDRGVIVVRERYGDVLLGPEFIQDITSATLAAVETAARDGWVGKVRNRALKPPGARDQEMLEIEILPSFTSASESPTI